MKYFKNSIITENTWSRNLYALSCFLLCPHHSLILINYTKAHHINIGNY